MATFVFTTPATDMRTGQRGTLVLKEEPPTESHGVRGHTLVLAADAGDACSESTGAMGVSLEDVESLEVTLDIPGHSDGATSQQASVVTLHLRDGSAASYGLSRSYPALVRQVFQEAGWAGQHG